MARFAKLPNVYMKLSGAFSEMGNQDPAAPWSAEEIVIRMKPWTDQVFESFGASRIMFGSDWPVCNVGGPGDEKSWRSWRSAVEKLLDGYHLTEEDKARTWCGTAREAYRLK